MPVTSVTGVTAAPSHFDQDGLAGAYIGAATRTPPPVCEESGMSSRLEKIAITSAADVAPCGDHVVISALTIARTTDPMRIAPTPAAPAPPRGDVGVGPGHRASRETIVAHAANAALALAEVS